MTDLNDDEIVARIVQTLDETSKRFSEHERQTNGERAMSLEIRSPRADRLAQELASATGEDIDTAVERAIEERLARVPRPLPPERRAQVKALLDRLARMPVLDPRSPEEIIGFDQHGVPS